MVSQNRVGSICLLFHFKRAVPGFLRFEVKLALDIQDILEKISDIFTSLPYHPNILKSPVRGLGFRDASILAVWLFAADVVTG